jgi:uncharacterized damage-inducible protein DinB
MTATLSRLLRHLSWADERTAQALASLPLPDPELTKLFAHVLGAEAVWLARIAGEPASVTPWPTLDIAACLALAKKNHAAIETLAASLTDAELARTISYTNTKAASFTNSVDDILHHVVMHGMYHRGQVALGVRHAGGAPLATDFVAYLREASEPPPH